MKPAPFEYHAPVTAADAVALLSELGDSAKPLAGGQSLVPMLALRLAVFDHLVDLGRIGELRGIVRRNGSLRIGAGTTQAAAERSPDVAAAVPLLARALPLVGHFQIRNRGTVGGSIAHADPASELPAVVLALDAARGADEREVAHPARHFLDREPCTSRPHREVDPDEELVRFHRRGPRAVEELLRRLQTRPTR